MGTKIFVRTGYRKINPDKAPREVRELDSFLVHNRMNKCFVKLQGGYYKMQANQLHFVTRALYLLSFKEWLEVAQNKNFTANIR